MQTKYMIQKLIEYTYLKSEMISAYMLSLSFSLLCAIFYLHGVKYSWVGIVFALFFAGVGSWCKYKADRLKTDFEAMS